MFCEDFFNSVSVHNQIIKCAERLNHERPIDVYKSSQTEKGEKLLYERV